MYDNDDFFEKRVNEEDNQRKSHSPENELSVDESLLTIIKYFT